MIVCLLLLLLLAGDEEADGALEEGLVAIRVRSIGTAFPILLDEAGFEESRSRSLPLRPSFTDVDSEAGLPPPINAFLPAKSLEENCLASDRSCSCNSREYVSRLFLSFRSAFKCVLRSRLFSSNVCGTGAFSESRSMYIDDVVLMMSSLRLSFSSA